MPLIGAAGRERARRAAAAVALVAAVAACGSAPAPSRSVQSTPSLAAVALPSDAPAAVRALGPALSCGATTTDVAAGGAEEGSTTPVAGQYSDPGQACLIDAFDARKPAQYVSRLNESGTERYTLYDVVGDGTIEIFTRSSPGGGRAATWGELICGGISVTDEGLSPEQCGSFEPLPAAP